METPDAVHVIHIAATPQAVWDALTDPAQSAAYFFGHRWSFAQGGRFELLSPDGSINSEGEVLVFQPPSRLRVLWRVVAVPSMREAKPGQVEWAIDGLSPPGAPPLTRLTVREYGQPPELKPYLEAARETWSQILSGMKTLIETGRPMPAYAPEHPQ